MKNINKLAPLKAVIFRNDNETLTLIEHETNIKIITDETDFEKEYNGIIYFVNEDAIELDDSPLIHWEYVEEINIIK